MAQYPDSDALDLPLARPLPPSKAAQIPHLRKPEWLKIRPPAGENYLRIKEMLRGRKLHTVCEEAHCPNVAECWASGTATIMLGSEICTRACRFCAVKTSRTPPPLDPNEPEHVAQTIAELGLHYVVLTSVDRDDLEDQAAGHFAQTVRGIKSRESSIVVEALVPDFRGDLKAVETVVDSGLDVYAHNVETVPRLQVRVRDPRANFEQSIATLWHAKAYARDQGRKLRTKTSIMVGLGETDDEILRTLEELKELEIDVVTLGQYLRPSMEHLPVERYVSPEQFDEYASQARRLGFLYVASGPMVRSSYRAAELFLKGLIERDRSKPSESMKEIHHGI